jgi:hypothetical protein
MQFATVSCPFLYFRLKYLTQHPVLKHLQPCSSINVTDQVLHPYNAMGKIIVQYSLIFILVDSKREDMKDIIKKSAFSFFMHAILIC